MCGGPHLVNACTVVLEYIKAGKCKCNQEGKVVLPSGTYILQEIPGNNFQEHIDEWHSRNPNQLAVINLFNAVSTHVMKTDTACQSNHATTYQLSTTDWIATLKVKLFTLKAKKANTAPAARTRAQTQVQKSRITTIEEEDEAEVAMARATKSSIKEVVEEPVTKTTTTATILILQPVVSQEHPFYNAKDAAYIPSANKTTSTTASTLIW